MRKVAFAIVAAAALVTGSVAGVTDGNHQPSGTQALAQTSPIRARLDIRSCTMALPALHATVEAQLADAADFCELVSQGLGEDVFGSPMIVTPGGLWHYDVAALSCRLQYGHTPDQLTIRNSAAACRWLTRLAPAWHRKTATSRYAPNDQTRIARPSPKESIVAS